MHSGSPARRRNFSLPATHATIEASTHWSISSGVTVTFNLFNNLFTLHTDFLVSGFRILGEPFICVVIGVIYG